jgi:hypothetical protein
MSLASYAELRRGLIAAADVLAHPTKTAPHSHGIDKGKPVRYGSVNGTVVFREGGQVGGRFDGRYLIARGVDHEESVYGLALHLGVEVRQKQTVDPADPFTRPTVRATIPDLGVQVDEVDAGHFWLFCLPEGYTLPEG